MSRRRAGGSPGWGGGRRILICGPHPPISREAAEALICVGRELSPLHNNCSGKHLGFLTLAMHLDAPLSDYGHPEHPVQREVRRVLSEMGGADLRIGAGGRRRLWRAGRGHAASRHRSRVRAAGRP